VGRAELRGGGRTRDVPPRRLYRRAGARIAWEERLEERERVRRGIRGQEALPGGAEATPQGGEEPPGPRVARQVHDP
jgi:hypothetical protein